MGLAFFAFRLLPAAAQDERPPAMHGVVSEVHDDLTITVDGVAAAARLAGVYIADDDAAADARGVVTDLLKGRTVDVRPLSTGMDRHGRILANVVRDDGLWVQAELIGRGLARMGANADAADVGELLKREDDARRAKRGLWSAPLVVRDAADIAQLSNDKGSFQIVEGRVVGATRRGDLIYLNFGEDFRTDFTATVPRDSWPVLAAARIKPLELTGHKVRVRGWITRYNGPAVEVTRPAALQVLE